MSYDKEKGDKLRDEVERRICQIAFFFETTMGFPQELFFNQVEGSQELLTLGDRILFIEVFRKQYPKHCDSLPHWKNL